MPETCSVTGSLKALPAMGASEICARFAADLEGLVAPASLPAGLRIALTLHDRGAIDAVLTRPHDGAVVSYPKLTVDVLDRALRPSDLTRLAEAAAGQLKPDITDAAHPLTGKPKRS